MTGRGDSRAWLIKYMKNFPEVDGDLTLDENLPPFSSITKGASSEWSLPPSDLGILSNVPIELFHLILSQVDLETLFSLRYTNQRLLQMIESMLEYCFVQTHVPNAIRAAHLVEASVHLTLKDLYSQLSSPKCSLCSDFGEYLYLPTCSRVCFFCLIRERCFLPLRVHQAKVQYRLSQAYLSAIPRFQSLPGIYSPAKHKLRRFPLLHRAAAYEAGVRAHGSKAEAPMGKRGSLHDACNRYPAWDPMDRGVGNELRFALVLKFPWLNKGQGSVEWGVCCRACADKNGSDGDIVKESRKKYTEDGLKDHIRTCPWATSIQNE